MSLQQHLPGELPAASRRDRDERMTRPDSRPVAAARELLARTVELPSSKRELLVTLGQYRKALVALSCEDQA